MNSAVRKASLLSQFAYWLICLLLLHWILFFLFDILPSAAYAQTGLYSSDPVLIHDVQQRLGLTGTWQSRYWGHLSRLIHGDLGRSVIGGYSVNVLFQNALAHSFPIWIGVGLIV